MTRKKFHRFKPISCLLQHFHRFLCFHVSTALQNLKYGIFPLTTKHVTTYRDVITAVPKTLKTIVI